MEQKEFSVQFYAGLFFLIGIVLILVVIFSIGLDKGFWKPKFDLTVLFSEVGGLSVGAPIRLSGVTVGSVSKVDFLPEEVEGRNVAVTCSFFRKHRKYIERAYVFRIATEGLLGQKIIEISLDKTGQSRSLPPGQVILGEDPLNVQDLARTFGDAVQSFQDSARSIDNLIADLQIKFKAVKRVLNRMEQRLIEGTLFRVF